MSKNRPPSSTNPTQLLKTLLQSLHLPSSQWKEIVLPKARYEQPETRVQLVGNLNCAFVTVCEERIVFWAPGREDGRSTAGDAF